MNRAARLALTLAIGAAVATLGAALAAAALNTLDET